MGLNMREAVQIIMAGRKAAKRSGAIFEVDQQRMACAGFTPGEADEIMQAVDDIERFTEERLGLLRRQS